jgi:hypothetical protein
VAQFVDAEAEGSSGEERERENEDKEVEIPGPFFRTWRTFIARLYQCNK